MHDYSIDRSPKVLVLFLLTAAAIFVTPYLNEAISLGLTYIRFNKGFSEPTTFVSVFGLFSLLYWAFNKYCWKWRWLRGHLLVPDLNGTWRCEGNTTLKDNERTDFNWTATVTITQSWSHILIYLKAQESESKSTAASICLEAGIGYRLIYTYANNPDASNPDLQQHAGNAELVVDAEGVHAQGNYFTDGHRLTTGMMKLRKVSNGD